MKLPHLLIVAVATATIAFGRHTLTPVEEGVIVEWLTQNPDFRQATDDDCDCAKSLNDVRTGAGVGDRPVPDYAPYRVAGDFDGDGVEDFAIAALRKSDPTTGFALLIFNGKSDGQFTLAYSDRGRALRGQGLFFGPPTRFETLQLGRFYYPLLGYAPRGSTYVVPQPSF